MGYPDQTRLIDNVQHSNIKNEDKGFVVQALQGHYTALHAAGALRTKTETQKANERAAIEKRAIQKANAAKAKADAAAKAKEDRERDEQNARIEADRVAKAQQDLIKKDALRATCKDMEIDYTEEETIEQLSVKIEEAKAAIEVDNTTDDKKDEGKTLEQMNKKELQDVCTENEITFEEEETKAQLKDKIKAKFPETPAEQESLLDTPAE